MITRLDSISGVIISMLASSVVNHDYKAGTGQTKFVFVASLLNTQSN